jgi:hypothetical protein
MPFNAKKLRVVLPDGEIVGTDKPKVLAMAIDLDAVTDEVTGCFAAANPHVTTVCFSHTCVDVFSDPVMKVAVSADMLPVLREALEDQLEQIDLAQEELSRRLADR